MASDPSFPSAGDPPARVQLAAVWLDYLCLGGDMSQQEFECCLKQPDGLPGRDRLILEQVLFERGL